MSSLDDPPMIPDRFTTSRFRRAFLAAMLMAAAALYVPAALAQAIPAWATAVLKRDAPAAAALAAFPLQNEVYRDAKTFGRAAYLRDVEGWSTLRDCLAREPITPVKGRSRLGTHTFNCDGHGFYFAQRNGVWRHTGYENSNE
jgi:hypothetical protein